MEDLLKRIKDSFATGKQVGAVVSALVFQGYETESDPIYGIGISFQSAGERVVCYHPLLTDQNNKTADP